MTLIYDGECRFCQRGVCYIREKSHLPLKYVSIKEAKGIDIDPKKLRHEIHLIDEDGQVYTGAHAILKTLPHERWLKLYEKSKLFAALAEAVYFVIARVRRFL